MFYFSIRFAFVFQLCAARPQAAEKCEVAQAQLSEAKAELREANKAFHAAHAGFCLIVLTKVVPILANFRKSDAIPVLPDSSRKMRELLLYSLVSTRARYM